MFFSYFGLTIPGYSRPCSLLGMCFLRWPLLEVAKVCTVKPLRRKGSRREGVLKPRGLVFGEFRVSLKGFLVLLFW